MKKMAAMLADDIFKCIFLNENDKNSRRQAITWTNDDPHQWHIYVALGGDELKQIEPARFKAWISNCWNEAMDM